MNQCNHTGDTRYARFKSSDHHTYYAVQCMDCGKAIKTNKHHGRLRIKHSDIPSGAAIFDARGGVV